MSYRLNPWRPLDQSVRKIAVSQIEDFIAGHGRGAASPAAVHEARKTIKRLRALLSLIRAGLDKGDLEREKDRLRAIAGSLAGARDAHVMIETAASLQDGLPAGSRETARALMGLLEERRRDAETSAGAENTGLPIAALEEARDAFAALPLGDLGMKEVMDGFVGTYAKGRGLHRALSGRDAEDEAFHDLRKQVQQHWRHLQLLCNAWPKVLRPQIAVAHELADTLGRDHDIAVLAAIVRDNAGQLGPAEGVEAYLTLCASTQEELRAHADLLARKLYAEKPKGIGRRIAIYWETARALGRPKAKEEDDHDAGDHDARTPAPADQAQAGPFPSA